MVGSPRFSALSSSYNRLASPKLTGLNERRAQRHLRNMESPKLASSHVAPLSREKPTQVTVPIPTEQPKPEQPAIDVGGSASSSEVMTPAQESILQGYLYGQIGNVGKFAVWWTAFSPLVLALFSGSSFGVGGARTSFNLALFILSPLAGVLAERVSVKKLLNMTTFLRALIYVFFLPASWVFLQSGWVIAVQDYFDEVFYILFLIFVFLDGTLVAFSNVVDIDCGGTGILAKQHGFAVDENTLNRFNSLHTGWFDASMIVLAPLTAVFAVITANQLKDAKSNVQQLDVAAIMGVLAGVFLLTSIFSLYYYNARIPNTDEAELAAANAADRDDVMSRREQRSCCDEFDDIARNIWSGLKLCWGHSAVRWRLLFLGLETAFEDAMISLILTEFAVRGVHKDASYADGSLLSNLIIAFGKFGAVIAAFMMHKYWTPPPPPEALPLSVQADPAQLHAAQIAPFRSLFGFVCIGGLFTLLVPVGLMVRDQGHETLSYVLVFGAAFFFFLFSTAPKIGFATLMQSLAAEADASGRIFGFVAAFLTATDSLVLMGLSAVFSACSLQQSLWISCGCIAAHGLIEFAVGPYLILSQSSSDESSEQEQSLLR